MPWRWVLTVVLLALATVGFSGCEVENSIAPRDIQEQELVGVWEGRYGLGVDHIIIRGDGYFRQIYKDTYREGYSYETPWNPWWLERLPDGRVWLHLQGARYYLAGIDKAEREGLSPFPLPSSVEGGREKPEVFYDPFGHQLVEMVGKVILNVRLTSSGELILYHMWTSSDNAFPLLERDDRVLRRVEKAPDLDR